MCMNFIWLILVQAKQYYERDQYSKKQEKKDKIKTQ